MQSAKILSVSIALAVILAGLGAFLWKKNAADNQAAVRFDSAETETVAPPVYLSGDSQSAIQRPLYLEGVSRGEPAALTAEQRKAVSDFKGKILARVASLVPLSESEKSVLSISISTTTRPVIGSLTVADQHLLQFSIDEIRLIERVLEK